MYGLVSSNSVTTGNSLHNWMEMLEYSYNCGCLCRKAFIPKLVVKTPEEQQCFDAGEGMLTFKLVTLKCVNASATLGYADINLSRYRC